MLHAACRKTAQMPYLQKANQVQTAILAASESAQRYAAQLAKNAAAEVTRPTEPAQTCVSSETRSATEIMIKLPSLREERHV